MPVARVEPALAVPVQTVKAAPFAELKLAVGGEAFAFQRGSIVMRLHRDGRVDGVVGKTEVQVSEDGTLSLDGKPAVRITRSALVKLTTNESVAIEQHADATKIVAGNLRFELEPDGTLVATSPGAQDRSVKFEGDPQARRTLFLVLVYTLVWSKVDGSSATRIKTMARA
jgi:hypothetical protein